MNLFLGREGQKQGNTEEIREKKQKSVQKEDHLIRQIDEFREKAKQLQSLLGTKEQQVRELETLVNEREEKAEELDLLLKTRRDEADRLIKGVAVQLQKMIDILDQKMYQLNSNVQKQMQRVDSEIDQNMQQFHEHVDGKLTALDEKVVDRMSALDSKVEIQLGTLDEKIRAQMSDIDDRISAQIQAIDDRVNVQLEENLARAKEQELAMTASLEGLKEAMDKLGADITEKVHTESVKCYRNTKGLIDEQNERFSEVELSEDSVKKVNKSFAGLKFLAVFALIDCGLLLVFLLYQFGIIG